MAMGGRGVCQVSCTCVHLGISSITFISIVQFKKMKREQGGATLHVAFWEGDVAEGLGEVMSASEELQEVPDSGSAHQEVFWSHSLTSYLHLQSFSFHLICQAHKDEVVYSLIAGSTVRA